MDDCWVVVDDCVYDLTNFMHEHPGGSEILLEYAGRDATHAFEAIGHSRRARETLNAYFLGEVVEEDRCTPREGSSSDEPTIQLQEKTSNHNT